MIARVTLAAALAASCCAIAAAQTPPPVHVTVGTTMSDDTVPLVYGERSGIFAKHGISVEVAPSNSGAAAVAAVLSGTYQFGKSSLLALISAHLHGIPVTIVAVDAVYDPRAPFGQLAVATDSAITSGKDFAGKTVAVPSLGDLNQIAISAWIAKHGGDPSTVKFLEIPNVASPAAVEDHRVDAAGMQQPSLADAVASGKVRVVGNDYDAIGNGFAISVFFTTQDYATQHPDLVRAFARGVAEAGAYQNTHHAETAPIAAEVANTPLAIVEKMPRVTIGMQVTPAQIQPVIDAAVAAKAIPHGFPASELIFTPAK